MKLTLENTAEIVHINDVPGRVWRGHTDSGIEVHAIITRIAVRKTEDCSQFDRELKEQPAPVSAEGGVYPLRMIIERWMCAARLARHAGHQKPTGGR